LGYIDYSVIIECRAHYRRSQFALHKPHLSGR
jgi:hypothetical protein